jgi:lipopolysaccharide biosynthesis regulator YciM
MLTALLSNPHYWLFALLPIAAASAYILGARNTKQEKPQNIDYFRALNDLLSNRTDQAIEAFTKLAETKQDEVDLHLALAVLFCRRGELDRAIYVHHRLLKNSNLSINDKTRVQLALADNYFRSGLFDRAETLLLAILEQNNLNDKESLVIATKKIISIFEREQAWEKAILQCEKLEESAGIVLQKQLAHYHCELAVASTQLTERQALIKKAQALDPDAPRPLLEHIYQLVDSGNTSTAGQCINSLYNKHSWLLPQSADKLIPVLGGNKNFIAFLQTHIESSTSPRLHSLLAYLYHKEGDDSKALETLDKALEKAPSFLLLQTLLRTDWANSVQKDPRLAAMLNAASALLNADAKYQCSECGVSLVKHRWRCPGCHSWDSILPLADIIPIPYQRPTISLIKK